MDFKSHPASLNTVSASINATADMISDAILLVQSTMTYGAIVLQAGAVLPPALFHRADR